MRDVIDFISNGIQSGRNGRNQDLPPIRKTLPALSGDNRGSFQTIHGDLHGMGTSGAHNTIHDMSMATDWRKGSHTLLPIGENLGRVNMDFFLH